MKVNQTTIHLGREQPLSQVLVDLQGNVDNYKLFQNNFSVFVNGTFVKSSEYDIITIKEADTVMIIPRLAGG